MSNMPSLYAVVYGPEWEDIAYYSDLSKAKTKLIVQSLAVEDQFLPAMYEYHLVDGAYHQSNRFFMVDKTELQTKTLPDFRALQDSTATLDAIKEFPN